MYSHLLIDKQVMHNLEFFTPLLSSDEGSKNGDTSESEVEDSHECGVQMRKEEKTPHTAKDQSMPR